MSGCCTRNVDSGRSSQSTVLSVKPAGRRADGEINRPDKLVVDSGRSSSGRGVRFPPVSTISKHDPTILSRPRQDYTRSTLASGATQDCIEGRRWPDRPHHLSLQIHVRLLNERTDQPSSLFPSRLLPKTFDIHEQLDCLSVCRRHRVVRIHHLALEFGFAAPVLSFGDAPVHVDNAKPAELFGDFTSAWSASLGHGENRHSLLPRRVEFQRGDDLADLASTMPTGPTA